MKDKTPLSPAQQAVQDGRGENGQYQTGPLAEAAPVAARTPGAVRPGCTEKCWTAVQCPEHLYWMTPLGRDAGHDSYPCCDNYRKSDLNPRHLWSVHDSSRSYTDPTGWAEHEATCAECGPEADD